MLAHPDRVITTRAENGWQARHRDDPELRAEGDSPRGAATSLAHRLEFALADVRAFLERSRP